MIENEIRFSGQIVAGWCLLGLGFAKFCLDAASKRVRVVAFMNLLFFGSVLVAVLLATLLLPPPPYSGWRPAVPEVFFGNWLVMFLGIFAFNLVLSAFVVVTLPGFLVFPLSAALLAYRGVLWGMLLHASPTWLFLAALPTVFLEGEAYVFAGVAGTVAGFSWIKPDVLFREEEDLSRVESFEKALREALGLYFFVVMLLLVAAAVETVTISWL